MTELRFNKRGKITDPSFLYIEWLDRDNPNRNQEVLELISDLDSSSNYQGMLLEDTLPFLTFEQGEKLFKTLQEHFGEFTLKLVSLANADTGKPSTDSEPHIDLFTIDKDYKEIMTPLMESTLIDDQLSKEYSYDDLAYYFTDPTQGILKYYADSLGVSRASLPVFPSIRNMKHIESSHAEKKKKGKKVAEEKKITRNKPLVTAISLASIGLMIGFTGVAIGLSNLRATKILETQNRYLYEQIKQQDAERQLADKANIFGRYFLAAYYSGDKEEIKPFLSDGDAKYTQPDKADSLASSILENYVTKDERTVELTYIISIKDTENKFRNERVIFSVSLKDDRTDKNEEEQFVVTSEPLSSKYEPVPVENSSGGDS